MFRKAHFRKARFKVPKIQWQRCHSHTHTLCLGIIELSENVGRLSWTVKRQNHAQVSDWIVSNLKWGLNRYISNPIGLRDRVETGRQMKIHPVCLLFWLTLEEHWKLILIYLFIYEFGFWDMTSDWFSVCLSSHLGVYGPETGWASAYPECREKNQSPINIADQDTKVSMEYQELILDGFESESSNKTSMKNTGKTGKLYTLPCVWGWVCVSGFL